MTGGFKMIVEDRGNLGLDGIAAGERRHRRPRATRTAGLQGLFNSSRANTPWLYLDIDRTKCLALGVPLDRSIQHFAGTPRLVLRQQLQRVRPYLAGQRSGAAALPRPGARHSASSRCATTRGEMVPLGTLLSVRNTSGPVMILRYNMYTAAAITGNTTPGTSSGQAVPLMQQIAAEKLPRSMAYDWTELTYMQLQAGNTAMYVFALAVVFVFLVLAAQYESWKLPLAVILVVPMCLLCSVVGRGAGAAWTSPFSRRSALSCWWAWRARTRS